MQTLKAMIKMEKCEDGTKQAVVIFPTLPVRGPNTATIYSHVGQHNCVVDVDSFIKSCTAPQTDDEKVECFDLMCEVNRQYKIGEPVDIIWLTGPITEKHFSDWKNERIKNM